MSAPLRLLIDRFKTPLGQLAIVADDAGRLCAVEWTDQENRLQRSLRLHYGAEGFTLKPAANPAGLSAAIRDYFAGELDALDDITVDLGGTPFQARVWAALRKIPVGATWSYAALARKVGSPEAVRAVGAANGRNPVSLVVPCHRVIASDGTLCGYGGGIERKRWLLAHERASAGSDAAASRARS